MKLISFDVETYGELAEYALQPFRALSNKAYLTSFAYAEQDGDSILTHGKLYPSKDDLKAFLDYAQAQDAYIVAWNTPFDAAWLIALGLRDEVYANKWLDGMLLWKHLTAAPTGHETVESYGLKAAVQQFIPDAAGYEKDVEFGVVDETLLTYNKQDAEYTLRLANMFLPQLAEKQVKRAALLESRCIPLVAETYVRGLHINVDAAEALSTQLIDERNTAFVRLKLAHPSITMEALNSPKQLSTLLYQVWGMPVPKTTDKGTPSTDKTALHKLAQTYPEAAMVQDYREAGGNHTKFCGSTLASVEYNGDGCTRPQAKIYGTYTGRMTYYSKQGRGKDERPTGVALHQWKRDAAFRRMITAPPGHTLLEFDFAGQEFRWMAVESGDETMLTLCQPGEDAHSYMGARIAGVPYRTLIEKVAVGDKAAKASRQLGKVANLSLQYRTSAPTLQRVAATNYGLEMSEVEAAAIHATYLTTYSMVPVYWKRQIYMAHKFGYVKTQAGRRVLLPLAEHRNDSNVFWGLSSTAINFPIQGVGADQKYLALAILRDYLPRVSGKFYFELHDGLFVVVPDALAEKALREIRYLLSNLPYKKAWGVELPVKFPVDAKIGKSWGDLKEVHGD